MPPPDNTDQTWLIEQFLRGNLPPDSHAEVEQRMKVDATFEQRVRAQWLILTYIDHQREATDFYRQWEQIPVDAAKRKETGSHKGIDYLPQLLMAAVVLLVSGLVYTGIQYSRPPQQSISSVPVQNDDSEQYNFSGDEDSVVVIQYNRLLSLWPFGQQYTWQADVLTLYGFPAQQPTDSTWRIVPTQARNIYLLRTPEKEYRIRKQQTTPTPLILNEDP